MIDQADAWKIVDAHGSSSGSSGGAARSGARREKKQSAKGLTCHKCREIGHCHKGRSQGSAQSADGDSVRGCRKGERGRGKGRGRGSHGRGGPRW